MQYLLAYTSNRDSLTGGDWATNGAGLRVSHKFGFGAIDAEAMVTRARHWISVPEQHSFTTQPTVITRLVCFCLHAGYISSFEIQQGVHVHVV